MTRCQAAIDIGLLVVYSTNGGMPFWHASVVKNTAHMVASEDILVNLDCGNLVGRDFGLDIVRRMQSGYKVLQYEYGDGTCGRIACRRVDFLDLNGYDEDALPFGGQDVDWMARLRLHHNVGQRAWRLRVGAKAVLNSKEETIKEVGPQHRIA